MSAEVRGFPSAVVAVGDDELPEAKRVWGGPNASLPAEEREALDWLTLLRFLGWDAAVHRGALVGELDPRCRCLVIARDPAAVSAGEVEALRSLLTHEPLLAVCRLPPRDSALGALCAAVATGSRAVSGPARWAGPGPGRSWLTHLELELPAFELGGGCVPWAYVGGAPLVVACRVGRGTLAALAAHPSQIRDASPPGTAVLKQLLTWGTPPPTAWLDLDRTLVLRMDDPGSAGNAHLSSWAHTGLGPREWEAIATDLVRRDARVTIGYVPGWLDDGDPERGELTVRGERIDRVPGRVHPAPAVRYVASCDAAPAAHDHDAEFHGIQALRAAGAGEVELHGYTHIRPDHLRWAAAADRYDSVHWYRELEEYDDAGEPPAGGGDPISCGMEIMRRYFETSPVTLACPGQICSERAGELALDAGLNLVAAETLALRDGERLLWDSHVRSPGLEWPDPALLDAGVPVVACFHDRDPALEGTDWVADWLDEWRIGGARALMDFRELAGVLNRRLDAHDENGVTLLVGARGGPAQVRPLAVLFRTAEAKPPTRLTAVIDGQPQELVSERTAEGAGRVLIPAPG